MRTTIVDERDVSIELPFPVFRVAVWEDWDPVAQTGRLTTFDVDPVNVSDVLEFARSQQFAYAGRIEVHCKFVTDAGDHATILLDVIER